MPDNSEAKPEYLEKMSISDVLDALSTDAEKGLSEDTVQQRLEHYGQNAIEEEKKHPLLNFLSYFWGPIPWMIEVAAVFSAVVQRWEDFAVIMTLLLINVGVSFWHEAKASNAIAALKQSLALEARVIRNGKEQTIAASQLVPGDIINMEIGDIVPADVKLLEDQSLSIDESALTGESLPADKDGGQPAYSGTVVKQGNARAVVTATGRETKFARTIKLVESAEEVSHFRRAVLRIGYFLILSAAFLVVLVVISALMRGDPWIEVILFAMVLIIAGIPAALPAVLSVTMSIGAGRLARWKAIVSKLTSMEEMAGLEVLCADKTGTLTKNELKLQEPVTISASDQRDLLLAAALTTQRNADDPIDKAILGGLKDTDQLKSFTVVDFKPFDPTRKRADAEVEKNGQRFTVSKGAPQVITDLVQPEESVRKRIYDQVDELGRKGFRCLGVARKEQDGDWEYLGLLPFFDPPREDSAEVMHTAMHDYHIDIRMITGDHPAIGRQVAEQIGMGTDIRLASDVFPEDGGIETTSGDERQKLLKQVLAANGFAEVTPENKFQIIKWFQEGDRIVGMTGDGVNDAPALKQADVGIAVVGATDAARSAADLVLTEKGLGVITRAIAESRRIFERMTSYATYRITETIRLLLFIAFSILIFNYYPVTAIMIVLLAILNDIPILAIAWDNAETPIRPVRWNMTRVITLAAVLGVGGVIESFGLFWFITHYMGLSDPIVQTMMFLKLLVAGHLTIYLTRNRGWFWARPWPSLGLFLTLEGTQILGTLVAVYGWLMHPIGWVYALAVWGYTFVWFFILAASKVITVRVLDRLGHQG